MSDNTLTMDTIPQELVSRLARLVYLLVNHPMSIPNPVVKYLPGGEWIQALSQRGAGSTKVDLDALSRLIELGEKWGPGSKAEAIDLIKVMVDEQLMVTTDINIDERSRIYQTLERLGIGALEETEIINLGDDSGEVLPIPKFDSGLTPLDNISGGFYQGIILLMGAPGTGKTSLMLTWMAMFRKLGWPGSLLYVENEIPPRMMKARSSVLKQTVKFGPNDKLICGPWTAQDVLDYVTRFPDPNRIIFFDSPDVGLGGGVNVEKRMHLESEYLKLISVKTRSGMVVASSWPNRSQRVITHMYQVSESVSKVWYADMVIGINPDINGLHAIILKNRFGPSGAQVNFAYNLGDLTWNLDYKLEVSPDQQNGHLNGSTEQQEHVQALSDWSDWS